MLSIDPGGTTGWAEFSMGQLHAFGKTDKGKYSIIEKIIDTKPDVVVCEDYRIYSGKRLVQAYSPVDTVRIIGAIEYVCKKEQIPLYKQMASGPKGFVTDDKLKDWGYWTKNPHVRDAVRHACYFLLFGGSK